MEIFYDTKDHTERNNSEVLNLFSRFETINYYKNKDQEENFDTKIFTIFENFIDFGNFKIRSDIVPEYMNFKKILIKHEENVYVICSIKSIRYKILKTAIPPFILTGVPNLKKYDIVNLMEKKPILILIYGTSGSGKSTMARRIASMYKIKNILSTDTVRKQQREKIGKEENPILHASTFETGEFLPKNDYKRIKNCLKINQTSASKTPIDPELLFEMA